MSKRWLFLSAAAVLIVVSLALVLLPGHKSDDEDVKSVAGNAATEPSATVSAPNSPSASGTSSPSPRAAATSKKPSPTPTTHAASTQAATKAPQQASGTASLAGRIRPGVTYRGLATFYDADGGGACTYDPSGDVLTGAMNTTDYESSKACGAYVSVHAANGATVTVRITNECPGSARSARSTSASRPSRNSPPLRPAGSRSPGTW